LGDSENLTGLHEHVLATNYSTHKETTKCDHSPTSRGKPWPGSGTCRSILMYRDSELVRDHIAEKTIGAW